MLLFHKLIVFPGYFYSRQPGICPDLGVSDLEGMFNCVQLFFLYI